MVYGRYIELAQGPTHNRQGLSPFQRRYFCTCSELPLRIFSCSDIVFSWFQSSFSRIYLTELTEIGGPPFLTQLYPFFLHELPIADA